jgi:heme exporter protein A
LLRLLAGFVAAASGGLSWDGRPVPPSAPEHRARLHFVGHADPVKPLLSVAENVGFANALAGGASGASEIAAALDGFGLGGLAATPGRFLSAGQKRRTNLARLIAGTRPLWLLDEPGVGLDRANRARLEAAIDRHRGQGGICILATHGDVAAREPLVLDFGG